MVMARQTILILCVMLLISLAGNWIQYRSATLAQRDRNLEAREFNKRDKERLQVIADRNAQVSTLQAQKDSVIISAMSEQKSLKSTIMALKKRRTGGPVVQDTIIVYLDSLVASVEAERDTVFAIDQQLTDSLQRSVKELSDMFSGQLKESMRLENDLNRERRKRIVISLGAGYSPFGNQFVPSVQIGWAIVKF